MAHSDSLWTGTLHLYSWCLLACFLWATSYIATRWGLNEIPPLTLAAVRFLVAALILLGAMGISGQLKDRAKDLRIWPIIVYGLLQTAGVFGFLNLSMTLIAPGRTAIINNTHPFYTLLIARVFLHEPINRRKILSLLFGFLGGFLILSPRLGGQGTAAWGNALALATALCFSLANTWGRKISPHVDTRILTAGQMLVGSLVLLGVAIVIERPDVLDVSARSWIAVLYLAIFSSLLPYLIWTHLLKFHEVSRLSLFVFSIPVMTSLLSLVIFEEAFSRLTLVGLGLIGWGLVMIGGRDSSRG